MLLTAWILRNFKKDQDWISEQNHSISPIVLGSPFSFVSEYAVHILGEKQKFAQVLYSCGCYMLFICRYVSCIVLILLCD